MMSFNDTISQELFNDSDLGQSDNEKEHKEGIWQNIRRITSAKPSMDRSSQNSISTPSVLLIEPQPRLSLESELAKLQVSPALINWDNYTNGDISHWSNWKSEIVGYTSERIEKKKPQTSVVQVQTEKLLKHDIGVGDISYANVKIQTDFSNDEGMNEQLNGNEPYPPSLFAFFTKIGDRMYHEVSKKFNESEHIKSDHEVDTFHHKLDIKETKYEMLSKKKSEIIYRLRTPTIPDELGATCVSWSPKGTQIAVAHGAFQHKSFCRHHSVPLTIWSLTPSMLRKGPLYEIIFDGCITCLEFHPNVGNLIAFGFYAGEVGLIDLNGEDKILSTSEDFNFLQGARGDMTPQRSDPSKFEFKQNETFVIVDGSCHAQSVTTIRWIHLSSIETRKLAKKNPNASQYFIVSTSLDGFIALWSVDKTTSRIVLERRYAVHSRFIPDSFKRKNLSQFMCVKELGITTWDLFHDDQTRFVCSTYGSFLFQGNLLSQIKYNEDELNNARFSLSEIYDPETNFIKQELDYTRSVSCNPFNPYIFVYATQNGAMTIRSVKFNDGEPIMRTYLADAVTHDVKWSPTRPMVLGVINENRLYVYDLLVHETLEVFSMEHEADFCLSLAWSKLEKNFVAVTDSAGFVNIWKLPEELAEYNYTEIEQLNSYAEFSEYTSPLHVNLDEIIDEPDLDDKLSESETLDLDSLAKLHFDSETDDVIDE